MSRPSDIARWARGLRAAEKRAAAVRRIPTPEEALEQAFDLWALNPDLFDQPPDATRRREVEATRTAWARLRRHWREQRKA